MVEKIEGQHKKWRERFMNNSRWKSLGVSDNEELLIELLMHLREEGGYF